jgi:hypothetical protein
VRLRQPDERESARLAENVAARLVIVAIERKGVD